MELTKIRGVNEKREQEFNKLGIFDTADLMPYTTVAKNTRSSNTEIRGTNGVHPSTAGYYAIGDAYFRTLVKVLNDLQA